MDNYFDKFDKNNSESSELFPKLSYKKAYRICMGAFGFSPHSMRGVRAKILTRVYGTKVQNLQKQFAWKSPQMAMKYSEADKESIIDNWKASGIFDEVGDEEKEDEE